MRGVSQVRKSILLVMVLVSMVVMAACDNTPATPVPSPTTPQSSAATATPASGISGDATQVPATTGELSGAKAGAFTRVTRSAPKGDLTNRNISVAKHDTLFESLDQATPSAEATPTEEVATEPGSIPEDWTVILYSDFSDGDAGTWFTGDEGDFSSNVEDGKLVMMADGIGFYNWSEETINWNDAYISTTVELDGPGVFGLSARVSKTNGKFNDLVAVITNSGNYAIYREVEGVNERVTGGRSTAIKKNGVNELALLGVGEEFTFFVNGKKVRSFFEEEITEGAWGTYIEGPAGDPITASVSNILFMGPGEEPVDEPTPTPEPDEDVTATPAPDEDVTATPEPDEDATATPEPQPDETVILSADFSEDNPGEWLTGEGDGYRVEISDGALIVESSSPSGVVATSANEVMDVADARIEATVRVEDSSEDEPGIVGVSARSQEFATGFQDWSQVFCGINNTGTYSCSRLSMAEDGVINFRELLSGQTDSIQDGEENVISLTGKGSRWTFEINGTKVGSFTDNSQEIGAWGVLVSSGEGSTTGFFSKIEIFER